MRRPSSSTLSAPLSRLAASAVLASCAGAAPQVRAVPVEPLPPAREARPVTPPATPAPPAPPPELRVARAEYSALPGWSADALSEVLPAMRRSCARLLRGSPERAMGPAGRFGTAADWLDACRAVPAEGATDADARAYFERYFAPLALSDAGRERGLFTGYYEAELRGSRTRGGRYTVPLYGRPSDLTRQSTGAGAGQRSTGRMVNGQLVPYYTRAEIEAGALRSVAAPLLWVDDAIEAFFLHIQGSGVVRFEDGSSVRVQYAGDNGRSYVPLGRVLIERGALTREQVSMQSIRAWLEAHPAEQAAVLAQNPSYVFFREGREEGSIGAEGIVLTPRRSLAVDLRFVPLGAPLYVDAEPLEPVGPIQRLVVAQDTGGAIRGVVRGDLFWGGGAEAYDRAGRMRQPGRYWMLVPRAVAARAAP